VSLAKRIAFWGIALMAFLTALVTLFWAVDLFIYKTASADRSGRFLGSFCVQALFWGFMLFHRREWRTA
jgi:hypothetical protein